MEKKDNNISDNESVKVLPVITDEPVHNTLNYKKVIIVLLILLLLLAVLFIYKKPVVTHEGEKIEKVAYLSEFDGKDIKVTYHGRNITSNVKILNNIDTSVLGKQTIEYQIPYILGHYKYTRIVEVVDNEKPQIVLNGEQEENVSYTKEYQEEGYTATDNYDGTITDKVSVLCEKVSETQTKYYYKVEDSSNNEAIIIRTINYVDDIKPVINLVGNGTLILNVGEEYKENGATAKDDKDGDLTQNIKIQSNVNTGAEGTYEVTYSVSDSSANEAIAVRQVVVGHVGTSSLNNGVPGTIYLTFDDGPSESITPHLLDRLKENGVKATFFILDFGESKEYLIKRIVDEGHAIAIHGGSHVYSEVYSDPNSYLNALEMMKNKIYEKTGVTTNIIRFPGGSSNTVSRKYYPGIMTFLTKEVVARGYRYYDWNVSSGDAGGAKTPDDVYNNVVGGLKKERANVVLMHDFSGNNKTLEAVPRIIEYARSQGYTFDVITESTPMITQRVAN